MRIDQRDTLYLFHEYFAGMGAVFNTSSNLRLRKCERPKLGFAQRGKSDKRRKAKEKVAIRVESGRYSFHVHFPFRENAPHKRCIDPWVALQHKKHP